MESLWTMTFTHDFVICSEHREQVDKLFSSTYSAEHSSRANTRDTDRKVKFQGVEVLTMGKYKYMNILKQKQHKRDEEESVGRVG